MRFSRAGLRLKPSKCKLVRHEVEFQGYIESGGGISADPKTRAVTEYPRLNDLRALRAFLGLLSYYQRFIPPFSAIAHLLYSFTLKTQRSCGQPTLRQHLISKGQLTQAPVLAYPQFGKNFLLSKSHIYCSISSSGCCLDWARVVSSAWSRPFANWLDCKLPQLCCISP